MFGHFTAGAVRIRKVAQFESQMTVNTRNEKQTSVFHLEIIKSAHP